MKNTILSAIILISISSCQIGKNSSSGYTGKWNLESIEPTGDTSNIENVLLLNTISKSKTTATISEDQIQFYQNDTLIETHKIRITGTKIEFQEKGDKATEGIISPSGDNLTISVGDYVYKMTRN